MKPVSLADETVRLFESSFFEFFSKIHVTVPVILFVPLIGYFCYATVTDPRSTLLTAGMSFVAGIVLWTLTEYLVHRFVFHYEPKAEWAKRLHYVMHGVHHDYPNDTLRLVMPPAITVPVTIILYTSHSLVYPDHILHPMGAGFAGSYLLYDLSHYAYHHWTFKNRIWQALRTNHMRHHFNDPNTRYGVTTSFWDRVFGTR